MSLFNKKEVPVIPVDSWVLCAVDRDPRAYSSPNECHAGRIKYHSGKGIYAVRFSFGTRWVKRAQMDVVDEVLARFVEPDDTESLIEQGHYQLARIIK